MKIFIAGSRRLLRLSSDVRQRLDNIVEKGMTVLVGDANGADKAVQQHLAERRYSNVTVFCMQGHCRNNIGAWPTRQIEAADPAKRDFAYFSTKDRAMASEASHGLMIWDGESRGTFTNILNLVREAKPVVVYLSRQKTFHTIRENRDLSMLLEQSDPLSRLRFETLLHDELHPVELVGSSDASHSAVPSGSATQESTHRRDERRREREFTRSLFGDSSDNRKH